MSSPETEILTIPLIPEANFVLQWGREAGRKDPIIYLSQGQPDGHHPFRGQHRLEIDGKRRLILRNIDTSETIELATFCGERRHLHNSVRTDPPGSCFLLNGNGFENSQMQGLQARIRDRIQREFGVRNVMVAPYDALNAAQLDLESIRPIFIDGDVHAARNMQFDPPSVRDLPREHGRIQRIRHKGRNWTVEYDTWQTRWTYQVQFHPPNGVEGWFRTDAQGRFAYQEHRLGACCFWAEAPNGRHRYISAFDQQENPPMYFLAQLPDGPEVTDYDTAIAALAPPIVQEAQKNGATVHRHGDIFFVPTNASTTSLEQQGATFNRRQAVKRTLVRGGRGGGSRWVTSGRNRRNKAVCLFGTGHTADRVATLPDGPVFVQGTIRHEPYLTEPDREPEHRDITVGDSWHLAVRNTVPAA